MAHRRRLFQKRRAQLQKARKFRALKRLERKEARWMRAVNHTISRRMVRFAKALFASAGRSPYADVWMEDLSGIRQSKQSRKARSDAGKSRHTWAYYDLEQKIRYKLELVGRTLHKRPAAYTSKSDHRNGVTGKRDKHLFVGYDGYQCDADWNAAVNLAQWDGFSCPLSLKEAVSVMGTVGSGDGVVGNPLNSMNTARLQAERG